MFFAPFGYSNNFASASASCAKAFNPKNPICFALGFSCVGIAATAPCSHYCGLSVHPLNVGIEKFHRRITMQCPD
jgi:hypothetical protein